MNNITLIIVLRFVMAVIFAFGGIYALRKGFLLIKERIGLNSEGSIVRFGKFSANLKTVGALVMLTSVVWAGFGYLTAPNALKINPDQGLIEFSIFDRLTEGSLRAVSLKNLQQSLKIYQNRDSYPSDYLNMFDLTAVDGFIIDENLNDIILFGTVDKDRPHLHLDDFIVALRNAWIIPAPVHQHYRLATQPSVSIDPDPSTLRQLQLVQEEMNRADPGSIDRAFEKWEIACGSPYNVTVMGIPFNTRFSKVMVDADYNMKKLVTGSDSLSIPGFINLHDMMTTVISQDQFEDIQSSFDGMCRFWFHPGQYTFLENEDIFALKQLTVNLMTEQQYVNLDRRNSDERENWLNLQYSKQFSAFYPKIAERYLIYQELENLFRFSALANHLKFKLDNYSSVLNSELPYFLNDYIVENVEVPVRLPGIGFVRKIEYHKKVGQSGEQVTQATLPVCGGVDINFEIGSENLKQDIQGVLVQFRTMILKGRPESSSLFWDIEFL